MSAATARQMQRALASGAHADLVSGGPVTTHHASTSSGSGAGAASSSARQHYTGSSLLPLTSEQRADAQRIEDDRLLEASARGDLELVQTMVRQGQRVNVADSIGATPLHLAARGGHAAVVDYLLRRGARWTVYTELWQHTPMHWAAHDGRAECLDYFIKAMRRAGHPEHINMVDSAGDTPLSLAAQQNQLTVVELLVEAGANIEIRGSEGRTACNWAAKLRHPAVVQYLVSRGADFEHRPVDRDGKVHKSVHQIAAKNKLIAIALQTGSRTWYDRASKELARRSSTASRGGE